MSEQQEALTILKKDKVIELVTKMLQLSDDITYGEFNKKIKALDTGVGLSALEEKNPEVGLANIHVDNRPVVGISTLSIIATITDILCGDRLTFLVDDDDDDDTPINDKVLKGVMWLSDAGKSE